MSNLLKYTLSSSTTRRIVVQAQVTEETTVDDEQEMPQLDDELAEKRRELERLNGEIARLAQEKEKLLEEMEAIRTNTQEEIANWWEEEQKKSEELKKEAYQRGYREGFQEGEREAEAQYAAKLKEAEEVVLAAFRERDELLQHSEAELLELSVAIARKVIGQELKDNWENWKSLVINGLKEIENQDEVIVRLPSLLYPKLVSFVNEWSHQIEGKLKVIPDSTLKENQCLLQTAEGWYDVSVDKQLDEIKKQLMALFEERLIRDQKTG